MVKISEEFVKAVHGRQVFVPVAQVVFSELAGDVTVRLEELRNRRIFGSHALRRSRQTHLGKARAKDALTHDEGRPPRGATLLRIVVGE